ncbi:MAG: tRNA pseudouridine(54/55) synthase Pus10, partial [Thermoplasmataceae archaeon]
MIGKVIYQRTPLRVSGSRSDLVRKRTVLDMILDTCNESSGELEVTAESGTYIKELINGDNGRTVPSLSSVYGSDLRVIELDVVRINRSDE